MIASTQLNVSYPPEVIDPATNMPFARPVMLWPCGESLSYEIAKQRFGEATEQGMCKPGPCTRCRAVITGYRPNIDLQRLVDFHVRKASPSQDEPKFPPYPLAKSTFKVLSRYRDLIEFEGPQESKDPVFLIKINVTRKTCLIWFRGELNKNYFLNKFTSPFPAGITYGNDDDFQCKDKEILKKFVLYLVNNNNFTSPEDRDLALKFLE